MLSNVLIGSVDDLMNIKIIYHLLGRAVMKKPLLTAMSLMLASITVHAADDSMPDKSPAMERATPDNTYINKRDRDERQLTPLDQSNTKADTKITQTIRKSIMKQDLSTNAKNIKIITRDGNVTLRGPVSSREEVEKIAETAKAVPGIKALNNQLEVK